MTEVVHWNPRRRLAQRGPLRLVRRASRVDNFGDLLGPVIVQRLLERLRLSAASERSSRLLAVGSILHMSRPGDVVWGAGINGKISQNHFPRLDVRAVRGPLTAAALRRSGLVVPDVYGDPALLLPHLWTSEDLGIRPSTRGTVYVPNLHDRASFPRDALDPRGDPMEKVAHIASAERVVASSLHGIIVAEAFNVPVAVVASPSEPPFKYEDYFEGTGRRLPRMHATWQEAAASETTTLDWDPQPLLDAFPAGLWRPHSEAGRAHS